MYRESKHDFCSTEDFEAAQRENMAEGKNLELKSDTFVEDKEKLESLRNMVEASDMPYAEKSRALVHLDEQAKVLEATWINDVEKPEEERIKEMEALIERAREYVAETLKNSEMLGGFKRQSGIDDSKLREGSKEQAELSARYERRRHEMEDFNNMQERLIENHRQVVGR
ncbi:MAG: hypothetical protein LBS53_01310 [Synergistaceae bacterium]|jgi:hypothetical protein|nr:hypothetical protein [Synergistaceae bacterium]